MRRVFIIDDEGTDDEEPAPKVHYKVILQEEEFESDDEIEGFPPTREFAEIDWRSRQDVQPWDPTESIFFRIQ